VKYIKLALLLFASQYSYALTIETPYPASPGDRGKYSILEHTRVGVISKVLHRRIGVDSVDFTRSEINCVTLQARWMGTAEDDPKKIRIKPTKWFDIVPGSSLSNLAIAACSQPL
jgi:hypothetical protein